MELKKAVHKRVREIRKIRKKLMYSPEKIENLVEMKYYYIQKARLHEILSSDESYSNKERKRCERREKSARKMVGDIEDFLLRDARYEFVG